MKNLLPAEHRTCSGIYTIVNNTSGKQYIGSAVNLQKRFYAHISALSSNSHANTHLQYSFNKHGADVFEFRLVELCDLDVLRDSEQAWIDQLYGPDCYNIAQSVEPSCLNARHVISIELISPEDDLVCLTGTQRDIAAVICSKLEAPPSMSTCHTSLNRLIKQKILHFRGWRLPENANLDWGGPRSVNYHTKTYEIRLRSPEGDVHGPITNLAQFCRDHGILNESLLHNLIAGRTRYVNGWSIAAQDLPIAKNAKTYNVVLIDPIGCEHTLESNLSLFAREHNLNKTGLQGLVWGKIKTHKGWRLKTNS